jgi:hypothetical protein
MADYSSPHPGISPEDNPIMQVVDEGADPSGPPRHGDSVFDQYKPIAPKIVMHDDGLPLPVYPEIDSEQTYAPPLSPETLVCMAQEPSPEFGRPGAIPKCKFYARQLCREPGAIDRPIIERWCLHEAQRGLNGAAFSLRDTEVPFCELRVPPDPKSEFCMDKVDARKIEQGKDRRVYPVFKTLADLEAGRTSVKDED